MRTQLYQEIPQALPLGTPSGKGVYLTVHPSSCPNTDTVLHQEKDGKGSVG